MTTKLTVTCTGFQAAAPKHAGRLRSIHIVELKLTIHDVTVHQHENGVRWAALPSKAMIDRSGVAKRDGNGKITYARVLDFDSRAISDAFSKAVINALLQFEPRAFDVEHVA